MKHLFPCRGRLNASELFNVLKLQNKLETTEKEIEKLIEDLEKDKDNRVKIQVRHV